jgi:hypothetical protein
MLLYLMRKLNELESTEVYALSKKEFQKQGKH